VQKSATPEDTTAAGVAVHLRALWVVLLGLALLAPICVPPSLPWLGGPGLTGWSTSAVRGSGQPVHVVTSVMRHAAAEGLMTGDVLVTVGGVTADSAVIEHAQLTAQVGSTLVLGTLRRGDARVVRVPVLQNPASLSAYFGYRAALVTGAMVVALLILVLRAGAPSVWPLAAALILIGPTTFQAGLPGDAWWAVSVRWVWQMLAAAYRFGLPLLICHFLVLHASVSPRLRSPRLWIAAYALGFVLLGVSTQGFTTPLAWTQPGLAKDIRLYSGALMRLVVLGLAIYVRLARTATLRELRWFVDAVAVNMAISVLTVILVLAGVSAVRVEMLSRLHSIALLLIPLTAGLLLTTRLGRPEPRRHWQRITAFITVVLTAVYALAIAGVAAVVLSSAGRSLDGVEWLLFIAIFLTAVLFSPVLRWGKEHADRRLFAHWIELEMRVATALERIGKELEPERITRRVVNELPGALDAERVRLVLSDAYAARLGLNDAAHIETVNAAALPHSAVVSDTAGTSVLLPVHDHDGSVVAGLCVERAAQSEPFSSADVGWQRTLTQGVAAALRNADTFCQLRRAQAELAEGERIAATGALAAGLAHEIKNPLAGLRIGLHLLERDGMPQRRLDRMREDLQRIDDLVSTLLSGSPHARSNDLIDLGALLEERLRLLQPLAAHRGARLIGRTPTVPTYVRADCDALRIVISNLLRNAIDAVDEDGTIEARVELNGLNAQLTVRDSGPGISDPEQKRIFELHHSTKPNGSGLGLALARREVEQLGGAIEVESRVGVGTTLRIQLPIAR